MKSYIFIPVLAVALVFPTASQATVHSNGFGRPVVESKADEFDDLLRDAWKLYEEQKYDEALAKCVRAAALRPASHRPHTLSGFMYMAQWKTKEASEAFAKAITLDPRNAKLHFMKATADRMSNAKEDALVSLRKAIELDPSYADAYALLGEVIGMGSGDRKEQIAAYRKAIELKPDHMGAYRHLGMMLNVEGDFKGAEELTRKALALDPKDDSVRRELASALLRQGRLKEARVIWEARANEKERTFPNFITLLERAEKTEEAKANLAKNPNDPEALLQMGLMVMDGESWVVDGRQERAIVYFKKALAIDPKFAKAQFAIVKAWIQVADTSKAKNSNVDEELAKLKLMDPKLAADAEAYRGSYSGSLRTTGPPPPKKN